MLKLNAVITEILQQYLLEEKVREKAELRDKLEDFIETYLSMVGNDEKFHFDETFTILFHSAAALPNFTAHGAAVAWDTILRYANNLFAQPWRKEFHKIRLFSGHYKHNIEVNLVEAWLIIDKLGYDRFENELQFQPPIDPDALFDVARDAITAYVECQMVQNIWGTLHKHGASYTWRQLFDYRRSNICSVSHAVSALRADFMHQLHQNIHCHDRFDALHLGYVQPPIYGQPRYGTDCYGMHRYNPYIQAVPVPVPVPVPTLAYCGAAPNLYQAPLAANVPTAQLIEVEGASLPVTPAMPVQMHPTLANASLLMGSCSQPAPLQPVGSAVTQPTRTLQSPSSAPRLENGFINTKSNTYASVDKTRNWDGGPQTHRGQSFPQSQDLQTLAEPQSDSSAGQDNWEYVYRDLEIQGYTKDVGERGDLLRTSAGGGDRGLNDVMHRIQIDDRESSDVDGRTSLYDNVPSPSKAKSPMADKPEDDSHWQCAFCTLHNSTERTICEACDRSRKPGPEEQPLASGGPECPKCTLVNKRDAVKCEVCDTELKGSPTYV